MASTPLNAATDAELALGGDLSAAIEAWLAHLINERAQSAATRQAYERDLRQFIDFLAGHLGHAPCIGDLVRLDTKTFRAFLAKRRKASVTSRSLARSLSALRTFSAGSNAKMA
jgi:integrase/recombinase XerC